MGEATGYYHKYNFLKFRIMEAALWHCGDEFTTRDIEAATGIPFTKVGDALLRWKKRGCGYFRVMPKRLPHGALRYKITKKGIEIYIRLLMRIKRGIDLNMLRPTPRLLETHDLYDKKRPKSIEDYKLLPEQLVPYIGITKQGVEEFGIDKEKVLVVAGIISKNKV
jgi:hypothetical protein